MCIGLLFFGLEIDWLHLIFQQENLTESSGLRWLGTAVFIGLGALVAGSQLYYFFAPPLLLHVFEHGIIFYSDAVRAATLVSSRGIMYANFRLTVSQLCSNKRATQLAQHINNFANNRK